MTTPLSPLDGSLIPAPRPHFHLRDGALYFLISQRPFAQLDDAERAVWGAMDGATTLADLRAGFPAAEAAVRRFWERGLCELVPSRFPAGRRRVLVVEPHMDDAVLSVGGAMWLARDTCEFTVLTVAGRSNFTSYGYLDRDYFDVDVVSRLRLAESILFVRMVGGRHVALERPEAPQRYRPGSWTLDWYRRHRASISAFIAHRSPDFELAEWTADLRQALRTHPTEEIWFPIGVGPHTDHELTRNACFAALLDEPTLWHGRVVRLYQEAPYASQFPHFTQALVDRLTQAGARLDAEPVEVTQGFADKLRLVSIFGSQFKLDVLRPGIEATARAAAGAPGSLAELFYRMTELPRALAPLDLNVDAEGVRQLAGSLAPWLAKHRDAPRVRLLLRLPAGRWRHDVELLLHALPKARIEAFVALPALPEAQDFVSPRVVVHGVAEGAIAWAALAARLALRRPAPTLFVAGSDRQTEARLLARCFPFSDTLVAASMNHIAQALSRIRIADAARAPRPPA
jgi:LmbE family N-acetylglucosaminyl deacetylase